MYQYDDYAGSYMSHNDTKWNCNNTDTDGFNEWLKVSVSISSVLSIFGALLVILTVSLKPSKKPTVTNEDHRSTQQLDGIPTHNVNETHYGSTGTLARTTEQGTRKFCINFRVVRRPAVFTLISISVADILVAVSHLWGVLSSYEHSLSHHFKNNNTGQYDDAECGAQAFIAVFGTISSFLWSDVLIFIAVVMLWCKKDNVARLISVHAFVVYSFFGWVVPFLVVMILGAGVNAFGVADGVGWCYMNLSSKNQTINLLIAWSSYDLWANASILFIICAAVLFTLIVCANQCKVADHANNGAIEAVRLIGEEDMIDRRRSYQLQCKMVTAALLVVTMRVWNLVIDVYLFKPIDSGERNKYLCTTVLHVLSGIGTSSQGTVNATLFVFIPCVVKLYKHCTKNIRCN